MRAPAKRLDGRAAGIAGGRHHDGGALTPLAQHMVHQPRHQLHGEVLEGERRSVEQLEHEQIGVELDERRGRRMAEGAVGLARHASDIRLRDRVADKWPDHLAGDLGIRPAGETADGFTTERRPAFRHI